MKPYGVSFIIKQCFAIVKISFTSVGFKSTSNPSCWKNRKMSIILWEMLNLDFIPANDNHCQWLIAQERLTCNVFWKRIVFLHRLFYRREMNVQLLIKLYFNTTFKAARATTYNKIAISPVIRISRNLHEEAENAEKNSVRRWLQKTKGKRILSTPKKLR